MTKELYYPFIATMLQGLPHTYREVNATDGTVINVVISTHIGGAWHLKRNDAGWTLTEGRINDADGEMTIDPHTAWKVFTKGITREEAIAKTKITGNSDLVKHVVDMISVMA